MCKTVLFDLSQLQDFIPTLIKNVYVYFIQDCFLLPFLNKSTRKGGGGGGSWAPKAPLTIYSVLDHF